MTTAGKTEAGGALDAPAAMVNRFDAGTGA